MTSFKFTELEIKKLPKSEIEIFVEISAEDFKKFWKKALDYFSQNISLNGFRKGNLPEDILLSKVGEDRILEKAAELAIREIYLQIIKDKQLEVIGQPRASIVKLGLSSPFSFKIKTAVLPFIDLPEDYKGIAKEILNKEERILVEDKEVEEVLEFLRKRSAKDENSLPPLNDDWAKSLGKYNSLAELKEAIKENLKFEKEMKARDRKRLSALQAILKKSSLSLPDVLIEGEKKKMLEELKSSIAQIGMEWNNYLRHLKKSEEDLMSGWDEDAERRVKYGLLLRQLARMNNLEVAKEEVEEVMKKYGYNDLNEEERQSIFNYFYGLIRNEKVFRLLEEG